MSDSLPPETSAIHWSMTRRLALVVVTLGLGVLAAVAAVPALWPGTLATLGRPAVLLLGQGVPLALAVLGLVYLLRQSAIDEDCDAVED
ncbi:MAG: hypothetical protein AAGI34_01585 [Pseudomonadota bacterium]